MSTVRVLGTWEEPGLCTVGEAVAGAVDDDDVVVVVAVAR